MNTIVEEIIETMHSKMYIIPNILEDEELYNKVMENLYDNFKQGFEIKELRECPVVFRFTKDISGRAYTLQMRHFFSNMCMWYPFVSSGHASVIDETYIMDPKDFTNYGRKKFLDERFIAPFGHTIDNEELNIILHRTQRRMAQVSKDFNIILGSSISTETLIDLYRKNAEFRALTHTRIDPNKQPKEVERELDMKTERLEHILRTEENSLQPIVNCGDVIKMKQVAECLISFGYKPDIDGNTLPVPINANMFMGGLSNITNLYLETNSSRKSLLANKYEMGDGGYFSILLMKLCGGIYISETVDDCSTVHPLPVVVNTKGHLSRLIGRFYNTREDHRYRTVTKHDTHLIGKTIWVRTPITCTAKDGICETCYGKLSLTNKGICVGSHAAAKLTEPLSQKILSTKHLLTTDSEEIKFTKAFNTYFHLTTNEIVLNINMECDIKNFSLLIIKEDIDRVNEFDDVVDYNYYCNKFYVLNNKTGETELIQPDVEKNLFLVPSILKDTGTSFKKNVVIPFTKLPVTTYVSEDDASEETVIRLFAMEILNNELTKPLFDIRALLNTKKTRPGTLEEVNQRLFDLVVEANIDTPSVMPEIVLMQLLRDKTDILKKVDFSSYNAMEKYEILTVVMALEKNPSVLVSLSSQALGRQMLDYRTYMKNETSYLDPLFKV